MGLLISLPRWAEINLFRKRHVHFFRYEHGHRPDAECPADLPRQCDGGRAHMVTQVDDDAEILLRVGIIEYLQRTTGA